MAWYGIVFWVWALVSFGIFVYRRAGARNSHTNHDHHAPSAPRQKSWSQGRSAPDPLRGPTSAPDITVTPSERAWPTPPPPDPDDDTFRMRNADPSNQDTATTSEHQGDQMVSPEEAGIERGGDTTLAVLLTGIVLPSGLVPLTQSDPGIDMSIHVVLATQDAHAEGVRRGLSDELERLGYVMEVDSTIGMVAFGPRGRLMIDIHPDAATVTDGDVPRFPTAAPGSVVVELRAW